MEKEYDELEIVVDEDSEVCRELGITHSLYKNCYCEALGAILRSIAIMTEDGERANKKRKHRGKESLFLGDLAFDNGSLRHSNIIAFIGTRGSGKTTAVNEFCEILSDYSNKARRWNQQLSYKNYNYKEYRFYIMPTIDASVLEEKEDLIELIWANMYQVFEKEVRNRLGIKNLDELSKNIMQEFNDVYKNYNNVGHSERREVLGESVLVKLKNVSSSLKTREAFEELMNNFLKLLDKRQCEDCASYLVITIDDLDLNILKGYDMLEQLHKYLFNHRIIVLIAVDYNQLHTISEKHFIEALIPKVPKEAYKDIHSAVNKAKKLTDDYLLKVLPLVNRIYLPGKEILSKDAKIVVGEEKCEIKDYILKKIACKTYIYYDACGSKKHFCLPNTVRELTSYNRFLDSLFSLEEIDERTENENRMIWYNQNYDRFTRDISDRMTYYLLDERQRELFGLIVEGSIDKRAKYAANFMKVWGTSGNSRKLRDQVDEMEYCYGDLLEGVYRLGRYDCNDKVLVHCILAFLTAEMVKEYYVYRNISDKKEINHLENFLGDSFGGEWFNGDPKLVVNDVNMRVPMEYIKGGAINNFELKFQYKQEQIEGLKEEGLIDEVIGIVPYLECISLLFSKCKDEFGKRDALKWEIEAQEGITTYGKVYEITIKSKMKSANFDIFGFIGKEIKREEYIHDWTDSIYECLKVMLGMHDISNRKMQSLKKTITSRIKKETIWEKREKTKGKDVIFPFYNLDMSYNIMKRVRHRMREEVVVTSEQVAGYFKKVYGYIAEELNKEDAEYRKMDIPEKHRLKLLSNFNNCPFIRAFGYTSNEISGYDKQDGRLNEVALSRILYEILRSINTEVNINEGMSFHIAPQ